MPTVAITSTAPTSDLALLSSLDTGTNYTNAVDGLSIVAQSAGGEIGQSKVSTIYTCWENFLKFDTSVLPPNISITDIKLKIDVFTLNKSGSDFIIQARTGSPSDPLVPGDWRDSSATPGDTLLAAFDTTGISTGILTLTSEAAFIPAINVNGDTELYLISDRQVAATAPTGLENVIITYHARGLGTLPSLEITYSKNNHMMNLGAIA